MRYCWQQATSLSDPVPRYDGKHGVCSFQNPTQILFNLKTFFSFSMGMTTLFPVNRVVAILIPNIEVNAEPDMLL